jgi:uncharacterized protein (DUF983 family)
MPITQCPKCGGRQLIDRQLIDQQVACIRCDRTFLAKAKSSFGHAFAIMLAGGAAVAGIVVARILLHVH